MKSFLLEAIANHLNVVDAKNESDNEDRELLRRLFIQHAFLLNAIESNPECHTLVESTMDSFMADQRNELKEEESNIITL